MITIKNSSIHYGNRLIITNLDLNFFPGQIYLIIGPSGTGKTSLLNLLNFELKANEYNFNDTNINQLSEKEKIAFRTKHISYVKQNCLLIDIFTVLDNLKLVDSIYHQKEDPIRIQELIKKLNIQSILHRKVKHLSGGEKQRVAIACALLREVDFYLFDEPTSMQDSLNKQKIVQCLEELKKKNKTVVIVTHDADFFQEPSVSITIKNKSLIYTSSIPIKQCKSKQIINPHLNLSKGQKRLAFSFYKSNFISNITSIMMISLCLMTLLYHLTTAIGYQRTYDSEITGLYEKELYVVTSNASHDIYDSPNSNPISQETISEIKQLDHVSNVEPMLLLTFETNVYDRTGSFISSNEDTSEFEKIEIIQNDNIINTYYPDEKITILPSYTHQELENRICVEASQTGIYISKEFANKAGISEADNYSLSMYLSIPVAAEEVEYLGYVGYSEETQIQREPVYLLSHETFPIKGIIQDDVSNTYVNLGYMDDLYLPIEDIQTLYDQCHDNFLNLINQGNNDISQIKLKTTNWEPSSLVVTLDNARYVDTVSQNIQRLNHSFVIHKPNFNNGSYIVENVQEMLRKSVIVYTSIIALIIILGLAIIYFWQNFIRLRYGNYLNSLMMSNQRTYIEYTIDFLLISLLSLVFVYFNLNYQSIKSITSNGIYAYPFNTLTIVLTIGLCFILIITSSSFNHILYNQFKRFSLQNKNKN